MKTIYISTICLLAASTLGLLYFTHKYKNDLEKLLSVNLQLIEQNSDNERLIHELEENINDCQNENYDLNNTLQTIRNTTVTITHYDDCDEYQSEIDDLENKLRKCKRDCN